MLLSGERGGGRNPQLKDKERVCCELLELTAVRAAPHPGHEHCKAPVGALQGTEGAAATQTFLE